MSNTISIHKKHIIEYAHSSFFNYGMDQLSHLFIILDVEYSRFDDCTNEETHFEVEVESLKEGLEKLNKYRDGESSEKLNKLFSNYFY